MVLQGLLEINGVLGGALSSLDVGDRVLHPIGQLVSDRPVRRLGGDAVLVLRLSQLNPSIDLSGLIPQLLGLVRKRGHRTQVRGRTIDRVIRLNP